MRKRIIATLMALCMALSLLPVQVLATEGAAQKTESAKQKTESAEQTTGAASGGAKGAYANGADAKIALLQGTKQAYQLFVKMPTESTITLNGVSSGDTIFSVKTRIARETGIPAEQMLLTFNDNGLADEKTLAECGIQRESTLILRLKITEADALAAAVEKHGTVTLGADIDIDSTLVIKKNVFVTLDLNGYVLRMTGSDSVFKVAGEGGLTVKDSSTENRAHTFTVGDDGLWVLDADGNETVTGGVITGGNAANGGGVYVEKYGWFTLENGSIVGCRASGSGGGVYVRQYGRFTLEGGSIVGCRADEYGGGVYLEEDGNFTLEKGSIMGCRAGKYGGGVYISRKAWMAMTGGEIAGCAAKESTSAGLYLGGGRLSANGGTVKDEVFCVGTIDSANGKSGCTEFQARVTNQKIAAGGGWLDGLIRHGNFRGTVLNQNGSGIDGGTFLGDVENIDAHLGAGITGSGGTFYGKVTNGSKDGPAKSARIRGGTFRGEVTNEASGMINGGTFYGGITNEGGTVYGHTVTYKIGETVYARQVVRTGENAADPKENRDGYTFDGWYNGTEKYDFSTQVTGDLTLTGQWRIDFEDVSTEEALREALANGAVGIRLTKDVQLSATLEIRSELTLDLNGYVLQMTGSGSVFELSGGGKLTVVDSDTTKEHKFEPNADHLWVLDETGGTETVHGGIIYGGRASSGGGVNVENGTLIMEGGSIVGCRALNGQTGSGSGGGVRVSVDGSFEMYDGAGIYGCTAGTIQIGGGSGSGGGVVTDGGEDANGTFFMYGGTIEGCMSGGIGGGVSNDGVFVMKGGSIRSCSVVSTGSEEGRGGSIHFSGSTTISGKAEISAPNNGKLHIVGRKTLTISGNAQINASMTLEGDLYADGGTISGEVATTGAITGSEGAAGTTTFTKAVESSGTIEGGVFEGAVRSRTSYGAQEAAVIRGGTFKGKVESYSSIENGVFAGTVESEGTISGGTFKGLVRNKVGGTIENGTFEDEVTNEDTIENGTFEGTVENRGTITGGAFRGEVTCEGRGSNVDKGSLVGGTVSGGSFDQTIQVIFGTIIGAKYTGKWDGRKPSAVFPGEKHTLTYQADGKDYAWQVLSKDFFPVMPQGPGKEGHTFLTWVYADGEDKGKMIDEGAPIGGNRTAVARYATGSGTEQDPCRIGSMEELLLFRLQVNWFGRTDLCAVLTNDIVINSGTFDADGRYTPAAGETVNDLYAIGSKERPYAGTFDGGGYTVRGLCCSNKDIIDSTVQDAVYPAGLFGWLKGATVKNLTVTGYVDGRAYVGGIAGHADAGTTILNCRNECIVVSVDQFGGGYGPAQYAGGIVGYNAGSVTACCNTGTVTGIDSVGGITGGGPGTVSDCYNTGAVTASGQNAGGIAGNGGAVSYCYNVGTVTGGAEIANNAAVNECFFLGTQGRSAEAFADGTVLTALIGGRAGGAHPWDTECVSKRLSDGGMRLPVLAWQKLSAAHEGGTATCTEKAVCTLCGHAYGDKDAGNHVGGTEVKNARKASCTEDGYTGDTCCKGCGAKLQSGAVIKAAGHTGGTATCVSGAVCTVCRQDYGKKDAGNHDLKHTAAKGSGFYAEGNIEYWQCRDCGKYFADAKAAKEITRADTVIPAMGRPDRGEPVKAPGTGDAGIALYGVTALLSLTGCAWLRRKKK